MYRVDIKLLAYEISKQSVLKFYTWMMIFTDISNIYHDMLD